MCVAVTALASIRLPKGGAQAPCEPGVRGFAPSPPEHPAPGRSRRTTILVRIAVRPLRAGRAGAWPWHRKCTLQCRLLDGIGDAGAAGSSGCGPDGGRRAKRPGYPADAAIDRGVMRDPQDPGGQAPVHVERGETADGFDEGFLGEILRQRAIAGQANEQRQDRALVTTDDLLDRRLQPPSASATSRASATLSGSIRICWSSRQRAYQCLRRDTPARCRHYLYLYP